MKRAKLMVLSAALVVMVFANSISMAFAINNNNIAFINVPAEAEELITRQFDMLIEMAKDSQEYNTYQIDDADKLIIGNPYIIYMLHEEEQDEVYYYPIIDQDKGQVIFNIGIMGTVYGYAYEIHDNLVELLNKADYVNKRCVVYRYKHNMYVQNEDNAVFEYGKPAEYYGVEPLSENEIVFIKESFEVKVGKIADRVSNLRKSAPRTWESEEEQLNAILMTTLSLRLPMGQYGYGMCWASVAATIINYIKQTGTVTPFEICTSLGIGYNAGGNIQNIQDALSRHNIYYTVRNTALLWNQMTSNIDSGKPIAVASSTGSSPIGHAVTIYGYGSISASNNIKIWDSDLNGGNGGNNEFTFGYSFSSNGTIYWWSGSVSLS